MLERQDVNGTVPRSLLVTSDGGIVVSGMTHADNGVLKAWLVKLEGGAGDSSSSSSSSGSSVTTGSSASDGDQELNVIPTPPLQDGPPPAVVDGNTTGHWRFTDDKGNQWELIVINGNANYIPIEPDRPRSNTLLDASFGEGGIAKIGTSDWEAARSVVIQPDGKVVVAGWTDDPSRRGPLGGGDPWAGKLTLTRVNPDGSLDTTFGQNGIAQLDLDATADMYVADKMPLVLLADGSFLVGGQGIRKLTPNGQLDTSFGDHGLALEPQPEINRITTQNPDGSITITQDRPDVFGQRVVSIAVLDDGTIVALDNQFHVKAYNADGSVRTSFATNGGASLAGGMPEGFADAEQIIVQNGKLLMVGTAYFQRDLHQTHIVLVRLNADGSLDDSFGDDGYVFTGSEQVGTYLYGRAVAVTAGGKILVAGEDGKGGATLARYNTDGSLDSSFANDGVSRDVDGGSGGTYGMAIADDGSIYISSSYGDHLSVGHYFANGSRDTSFGDNGFAALDVFDGFNIKETASALAIQSDGQIILVGGTQLYNQGEVDNADFLIARLDPAAPSSSEGPPVSNGNGENHGSVSASSGDVTPDDPLFSTERVASSNGFDFDDPMKKEDELLASPQESVLPT